MNTSNGGPYAEGLAEGKAEWECDAQTLWPRDNTQNAKATAEAGNNLDTEVQNDAYKKPMWLFLFEQ